MFECNSTSGCDESCFNRVVGRGISLPLQVFKTVGRGWGVRSRNPIRAGTFVCEYTGVMLRDEDAEAAGLEVGSSELLTSHEGPSGVDARTQDNPELCVDASRTGSVARFVNHCCDPNLFSVFVEYSRHVHRIALFAARDILAYEELTYDYGYVVGSVQDKTLACLCGAANCRGTLV
uniref:SET domain-containing protein n=1 Tax=Emiliania huxleyi (strain CCMP1516) TaxID=280463 RepID=A0A0D3ILG4_EMIH1